MILIDRNIKERVEKNELIIENYLEENLTGISYDLRMDCVYDAQGRTHSSYILAPGETVFVKTMEQLEIPHDILGRIAEKNSRMRQGLRVDGPHYQPGHRTYAFLRVSNIAAQRIRLDREMKIAQIIFEELKETPMNPYDLQEGASFQNETSYRGLGNYQEEYEHQIVRQVDQAKTDLEHVSRTIYANVLTIMGVLVAVLVVATIVCGVYSFL